MPLSKTITLRHAVFDKWKILMDPKDRPDFLAELINLEKESFIEGRAEGYTDGREAEQKEIAKRELPLERGKG